MVHVVWRLNKNPDNICIPLLTAIGDLLGVSFLFLCFHLVYLSGNSSFNTHDPTPWPSFNEIVNSTKPYEYFSTTASVLN